MIKHPIDYLIQCCFKGCQRMPFVSFLLGFMFSVHYYCHQKLFSIVDLSSLAYYCYASFRILEDVISRSRKSVRLWSYPSLIMNYTNKLVLILLVVYYYMGPLALVKLCLPRLLLIIPLLPLSELLDLNLFKSTLGRYDFLVICV